MDFIDEAVDCVERAEAAALRPVPGQTFFLAVYITSQGKIRIRHAHSAVEARLQLPNKILQQGLWVIVRDGLGGWTPCQSQFDCLTPRALKQFAEYAGQHWQSQWQSAKQRHPAFANVR